MLWSGALYRIQFSIFNFQSTTAYRFTTLLQSKSNSRNNMS